MEIVVQIGAGGDDPIDEARLEQRDNGGAAEAGGCKRAGERQADGAVIREHLTAEEPAGLTQAGGVVGLEGAVDEIGHPHPAGDRRG